ncbi:hypothetical protein CMI47_08615 [Candidatus Pacearchaeota archaeon]|jgi:hypothetical protein|nr:hypothetical protein [Candidatus Pacearchaeota archaeon]|tara:strand:- start:1528 stop:2052 length:525 start_codon:yes stop_codon:yes gene_type:complete
MDETFLDSLFIDKSEVAGSGMFCKRNIPCGSIVAPLAFEYKYDGNNSANHSNFYLRSDVCRFTNHGFPSNCDVKKNGDTLYLVSSRDIPSNDEITVDYFDTIEAMNPYPSLFPYIKKELIMLMPDSDLDLFVNKKHKYTTYIDDLLDFSLKGQGCLSKIKTFYELLKKLNSKLE